MCVCACVCKSGGQGGVGPPAQTQSCDRTWPYLIKGRRSLPNNWAIKDYFQPHNRGAVGRGRGEKERERKRERRRREERREGECKRGEGCLSVRGGSELKKASRREPSVWMHSLISKKKKRRKEGEERGG